MNARRAPIQPKKTTAKEKEDLASSQDTESASQVPDTQAA
jgi:hypothetical protein